MKIQHLEVLVMDNNEILCEGKTIGWADKLSKYLSEPDSKKPITKKDGTMLCPICGEELAGDGENGLECMNCDYSISERNL